jgi:hypothetical protein
MDTTTDPPEDGLWLFEEQFMTNRERGEHDNLVGRAT